MTQIERVALVTGGGSGIGKAIAGAFITNGYRAIIIGRTESKLQSVEEEYGDRVTHQVADIGIRSRLNAQ